MTLDVDWDTKQIIVDMLDANLTGVDVIKVSDDSKTGGPKASNISRQEIHVTEENRNIQRDDVTYNAFDLSSQVMIEIKSPNEDVQALWADVISILNSNRTRSRGLSGGWDLIEYEDITVTDPSFNLHDAVIQVRFFKASETSN